MNPGGVRRLLEASSSPGSGRRGLEVALEAVEEAGQAGALVAVVHATGQVEARGTPGAPIPSPAEIRDAAAQLVAAEGRGPGPGGLWFMGAPVGDGGVALIGSTATGQARGRVEAAAGPVLLALARWALLVRARRRAAEVERLDETARRVASFLDRDEVLTEIVRDAVELVGADSGDIVLREPERDVMVVVAVTGLSEDMLGFELALDEGVSSRTMAARRTIIVADYQQYRHRVRRLDRYGFRAVVSTPLISRGEPIGALNVHTTDAGHPFSREDARLLTTFASHAAVAIDNAGRYENEARLARDLAGANEELARSLTLQQRLAEQVLLDRGPAAVVQELATLLDRPVVVQDVFFRVIAGASTPGGDPWEPLVLSPEAARDPEVARFLREQAETGRAAAAPIPPLEGPPRLLAPLRAGPGFSGYLILPSGQRLEQLDRALIEVASTGVALELAKLRAQVEAETRIRGDVVTDLVSGSYTSPEAIVARASRLGYDLTQPRDVLVLDLEDGPEGEDPSLQRRRFVEEIEAEAAERAPGSMVAGHGDLVLLLAARNGDEQSLPPQALVEALRVRVAAALPGAAFSAAIGEPAQGPDDVGPSYRLARQALEAARRLGRRGAMVDARHMGVARLVIGSSSPEELSAFARRTLEPLLRPTEQSRHLLETLRTYLDAGFNQRETARRCFVHINTVAYRLRRIEDLLGIHLGEPETLMDLTFAIRVVDLLGIGEG